MFICMIFVDVVMVKAKIVSFLRDTTRETNVLLSFLKEFQIRVCFHLSGTEPPFGI